MTDIAELVAQIRDLAITYRTLGRMQGSRKVTAWADALERLDQENQALATTVEARIEPVGLHPEDMLTWEGTLFRRQVSPWVEVPDDQF